MIKLLLVTTKLKCDPFATATKILLMLLAITTPMKKILVNQPSIPNGVNKQMYSTTGDSTHRASGARYGTRSLPQVMNDICIQCIDSPIQPSSCKLVERCPISGWLRGKMRLYMICITICPYTCIFWKHTLIFHTW